MQWVPVVGLVAVLGLLTVLPAQSQTASPAQKQIPPPPPVYQLYSNGAQVTLEAAVKELADADVVFFGEQHDDRNAHGLELALLERLYAQNPHLMLSLEMFERDVQGVVDEYLDGYITETHFLQSSRPWPNYKEDYRPLIEFCKEHKLPVVAANAPRRYVNIVSRKGQTALLELPKASRVYLAPLPYSMTIPPEYDRQLTEIFGAAHDTANSKPAPTPQPGMPDPALLKQAQGLWDSTMADSIARAARANRGRQILQVNGAMHSDNMFGIAARLHALNPRLRIKIVTVRPDAAYPALPSGLPTGLADIIAVTPPAHKPETP
ncbi:MAG: putative iron-regulated protein [Chthonomonadaceae bacterium]|nr:putative iron-regulated protein [Chthonomonadaceae bacterium]